LSNKGEQKEPRANVERRDNRIVKRSLRILTGLLDDLLERGRLAVKMGKSFDGNRDLYAALGYPLDITFEQYLAKFKRQGLAKVVVRKPVNACWRARPPIDESHDAQTPLELEWDKLVRERRVYHYLARADTLACIGQYAVLFLGFSDGLPVDQPVQQADKLLYLMPYAQSRAKIVEWEDDTSNPRYGQPKIYELSQRVYAASSFSTTPVRVHWSRVIHVINEPIDSETVGTPALEAVYNDLQNLELVSGGSAEMFWRGALPGMLVEKKDNYGKPDQDALDQHLYAYIHKLSRILKVEGVDVKMLAAQVADPTGHAGLYIDLIAAATGIPKRILMGSERGELSSTEDKENWALTIDERRREHCEPNLLRPFADRLIDKKTLPEPKSGTYSFAWPDASAPTEEKRVEIGAKRAAALKNYLEVPGADMIVNPEVALDVILGLKPEDQKKLTDAMEVQQLQESTYQDQDTEEPEDTED
jgi:hypothetical protein